MRASGRGVRFVDRGGADNVWTPDLKRWGKPHYLAIADALADDIRTGHLLPGTRLPTQRALAATLDLNFTTVSRGYVEAHRRGLIEGRVGRGTFVVDPADTTRPAEAAHARRPGPVDFTMNLPPEPDLPGLQARMRSSFAELSGNLADLLRYQGFGGTEADKEAALRWLGGRGIVAARERLLICPGTHSALSSILGQVAQAGDTICAERITYPGIRTLAAHQGLRLVDGPEPRLLLCERHVVLQAAGGGIGFALGLANGLSRLSERLTDTSVQMVRNVPHLSLIPLVILWFGIDEGAKLFLVALGVFFPIYANTLHGIRSVDPQLIEMGRVYGMNRRELFWRVVLPGALPSIFVGIRYALGIMWLTLIVAETISANSGLGYMAMQAREFMLVDVVVLAILIYAALGKLADSLTRALERTCLAWNPAYRNA